MRDAINHDRRRFLGIVAMTITTAQAPYASRERHPRSDDSCRELLLAESTPAERCPPDLPGLRTRLPVPVSRVIHAASWRFPRL